MTMAHQHYRSALSPRYDEGGTSVTRGATRGVVRGATRGAPGQRSHSAVVLPELCPYRWSHSERPAFIGEEVLRRPVRERGRNGREPGWRGSGIHGPVHAERDPLDSRVAARSRHLPGLRRPAVGPVPGEHVVRNGVGRVLATAGKSIPRECLPAWDLNYPGPVGATGPRLAVARGRPASAAVLAGRAAGHLYHTISQGRNFRPMPDGPESPLSGGCLSASAAGRGDLLHPSGRTPPVRAGAIAQHI